MSKWRELVPSVPKKTINTPLAGQLTIQEKLGLRDTICQIEAGMEEHGNEADEMPPVHHTWGGMFVRELVMPAGTVIVSKIHAVDHLTFALEGVAEVVDEFGGATVITAPAMIKTPAGMKRMLRIVEDSRWMTVHATDKETYEEVVDDVIRPTFLPLLEHDGD